MIMKIKLSYKNSTVCNFKYPFDSIPETNYIPLYNADYALYKN